MIILKILLVLMLGEKFLVLEHFWEQSPKHIHYFTDQDAGIAMYIGLNSGAHNVYVENDRLYTLSPSAILEIGLSGGVEKHSPIEAETSYWRGLARTEDYWYVGVSEMKPRNKRSEGNSRFMILDSDFQLLELVELEDTGQLCDIRALSGDRAHNGIDFE